MPAARQRSRSPCIARAVTAMIGMRRRPSSISRMAPVVSSPSMPGICTSIRIRSNVVAALAVELQRLLAGVGDDGVVVALRARIASGQLLVRGVVLDHQNLPPGFAAGRDAAAS